ncbi:MAG: hypothetical protein NUV64_02720 [Parcubacteria group bacterium]|nr:hypothetical protein [Parcubacteria group bacterium]
MEPTSDLKNLIRENIRIAEDNNRLLRKIVSANRWARIFKLLYWVIIISSMVGVYYYVQPILIDILDTYKGLVSGVQGIQKTGEAVGGAVNPNNISPDLIEKIKKLFP